MTEWLNWTDGAYWGFPCGLVVKNSLATAGYSGSFPGSGRSLGEGNGNPFPYSCLDNPTDRGAWWIIIHGVAKSQTQLSMHTWSPVVLVCRLVSAWACMWVWVLSYWFLSSSVWQLSLSQFSFLSALSAARFGDAFSPASSVQQS